MKYASLLSGVVLSLVAGWFPSAASADEDPCYITEWPVVRSSRGPGAPYQAASAGESGIYVTQNAPALIVGYSRSGVEFARWGLSTLGCFNPYPYGIAVGPDGATYVVDSGCHRIQKFDANHNLVRIWGGFSTPLGIAISPAGLVYVADTYNHRIRKFDSNGVLLGGWGTFGAGPGQFNTPHGVATDADGNVYVLDTYNQRVQVFDENGQFLRMWGETGFGSDVLIQPAGIDVASNGDVYVADTGNHQIVRFDSQGNRLGVWGTYGRGPGEFISPNGILVEDDGMIYVVDSGNGRVQKFAYPVAVDLCVEPRNLKRAPSGRWVTASIVASPPRTADQIVVSTLRLNGVAPEPGSGDIGRGCDGQAGDALRVKFDRQAVAATAPPGGDVLPLELTGTFQDGVCLIGRDTVQVRDRDVAALAGDGLSVARLQIAGVRPNPAREFFEASILVPSAGTVKLEMFDVGGRRVHSHEASFAPGRHSVHVRYPSGLSPGLYLLRITQGVGPPSEVRVAILR
jgi:streptogramin lyase